MKSEVRELDPDLEVADDEPPFAKGLAVEQPEVGVVVEQQQVVFESALDVWLFGVGLDEDGALSLAAHRLLRHQVDVLVALEVRQDNGWAGLEHRRPDFLVGEEADDFELVDDVVEEELNHFDGAVAEDGLSAAVLDGALGRNRYFAEYFVEYEVVHEFGVLDLEREAFHALPDQPAALLVHLAHLLRHNVHEPEHLLRNLLVPHVLRQSHCRRVLAAELFEEASGHELVAAVERDDVRVRCDHFLVEQLQEVLGSCAQQRAEVYDLRGGPFRGNAEPFCVLAEFDDGLPCDSVDVVGLFAELVVGLAEQPQDERL